MLSQQQQLDALKETQIQLALHALKQGARLSLWRAADICKVSTSTLHQRRTGRPSRVNSMANSQNLTNTEERVVIKHIIYLASRGSPPPPAASCGWYSQYSAHWARNGSCWPKLDQYVCFASGKAQSEVQLQVRLQASPLQEFRSNPGLVQPGNQHQSQV